MTHIPENCAKHTVLLEVRAISEITDVDFGGQYRCYAARCVAAGKTPEPIFSTLGKEYGHPPSHEAAAASVGRGKCRRDALVASGR